MLANEELFKEFRKNIAGVLSCCEDDIGNFEVLSGGYTNINYTFDYNGEKYVYRHPGVGTENLISRKREKFVAQYAKQLGIDRTYIYIDENQGWKITKFIPNARYPDCNNTEDLRTIISILKTLHSRKLDNVPTLNVWEEALRYEQLYRANCTVPIAKELDSLKEQVRLCYEKCVNDGIETCFCHFDTMPENFLFTNTDVTLIDWEYSCNSDPGSDLGTYILNNMWDIDKAKHFIFEYYGSDTTETILFHHLAYTAIVSFMWYCWCLYMATCGNDESILLSNYYSMTKKFAVYLIETYSL